MRSVRSCEPALLQLLVAKSRAMEVEIYGNDGKWLKDFNMSM
jgi:hypothetical protein